MLKQRFYHIEDYFWRSLSCVSKQMNEALYIYINELEIPFFNFIYLHHAVTIESLMKAQKVIEEERAHYLVVVDESIVDPMMISAQALGLEFDMVTTAMTLDLTEYSTTDDAQWDITCVNDDLSPWLSPLQSAFGMEDDMLATQYATVHRNALAKGANMYHFVLSVEGKPVTALTLTLHDGIARLDDIGTCIAYQGRGYGTAMIQHALRFAKSHHAHTCCLEASKEGLRIYQALGFQSIFNYYGFVH